MLVLSLSIHLCLSVHLYWSVCICICVCCPNILYLPYNSLASPYLFISLFVCLSICFSTVECLNRDHFQLYESIIPRYQAGTTEPRCPILFYFMLKYIGGTICFDCTMVLWQVAILYMCINSGHLWTDASAGILCFRMHWSSNKSRVSHSDRAVKSGGTIGIM